MARLFKALKKRITDTKIRALARLHETPLDRFKVQVATEVDQYEDAFRLLHVAYVYQGIQDIKTGTMRITAQHVLPEATVFVVYDGETIAGTMTVTLDSPAGLPLEYDYPDKVGKLRAQNALLVEFGSLAVRKCYQGQGVTNLLNIAAFHWAINILKATHLIIGIHPRAAIWHRANYNFEQLGSARPHAHLSAPVQGMVCDLRELADFLRAGHNKPMASGILYADHVAIKLPGCVQVPQDVTSNDLARWKLPREVFREIFVEKSDHLVTLDERTREYLRRWRTEGTTECEPFRLPQAVCRQ